MGFLTTIFKRASLENPAFSLNDPKAYEHLSSSPSETGIAINTDKALTLSAFYRGVNLLSNLVAKVPLYVYRRLSRGKTEAKDHPGYKLLKYMPCEEITAFDFKKLLQVHAIIRGNGYAYVFRDTNGRPLEIIPLSPDCTYPVMENRRLWYITEVRGETRKLWADDVIHIKGLGWNGLEGFGVLDLAKESLGLSLGLRKYGAVFFKNNARAAVVLRHPAKLSPEAAKNLRESWERIHQGLDNAHRTAVLEEGMSAEHLTVNARDSQLIEQRTFETREIANFLDLPAYKLGDPSRTAYASVEQENQSILDDTLDPWLITWEQQVRDKVLTRAEQEADTHTVEFRREALLRANLLVRYQAYAIGINNRFLNPNEVRDAENLNPYDGGDEYLVPLNMGNPGGDPATDPVEEKPTPQPAASKDLVNAQRSLLEDTLRRMVTRLQVHARKAAKTPSRFLVSLDEIGRDHQSVIAQALTPVLRVCHALTPEASPAALDPQAWAAEILDRVRGELLEAAGRSDAARLPAAIETETASWEDWPAFYSRRWAPEA